MVKLFGNNPSDPAMASTTGELNKLKPDIGFGYGYSEDYFIGFKSANYPSKTSFCRRCTFQSKGRLIPHVFLTGGYRFMINEDINAIPSVMVKYISGAFKNDFQAEGNLKLQFRDLLWIGGSYRQFDGYAAMIGLNVANTFNVGYAHDFTKTDLRTYSRGTHEIMIGFLLGNRYGDTCPRNIW